MSETLHASIWRGGKEGSFQTYRVPRHPSQTILDVVTYVQRRLDSTLAYRFACRVGMCGSCAMSVNGVPRWTCRTHVAARTAADAGIECIGCGVCYAACDVVGWRPDFLGPAALNRAWTLVNDVRDVDARDRVRAVAGDAGCHACHTQGSCTTWCPKHLSPTAAIAGLKRVAAKAAVRNEL